MRGGHRGAQAVHAVAKFREALLGQGKIDAVVHAIAGQDDVGLGLGEDAGEPLVEIGPGKLAAGVAGFRETRDRLARQAEADDFTAPTGDAETDDGFDEIHVGSAVGDAVAEDDDASGCREGGRQATARPGRRQTPRLGGERGQGGGEKKKQAHGVRPQRRRRSV